MITIMMRIDLLERNPNQLERVRTPFLVILFDNLYIRKNQKPDAYRFQPVPIGLQRSEMESNRTLEKMSTATNIQLVAMEKCSYSTNKVGLNR